MLKKVENHIVIVFSFYISHTYKLYLKLKNSLSKQGINNSKTLPIIYSS